LDPTPGMRTKKEETAETSFPHPFPSAAEPLIIENNKVEENEEQVEPLSNFSNVKEVSTEAQSFVTIPLKTQLEPQVSSFQCLEEPSYVEIFKDSRTQDHKSRNHVPKRIFQSKLLGYIRW
jgi:hypothetical protein